MRPVVSAIRAFWRRSPGEFTMCIGIPMRVIKSGQGMALAFGRGRREHIDTRLVGDAACRPGRWLLVFQGAAREALDPARAAQIDATLDLLEAALVGDAAQAAAHPGFALPSAMSASELSTLARAPVPEPGASR
jgi:hydrogenase expression/formation protein HypC